MSVCRPYEQERVQRNLVSCGNEAGSCANLLKTVSLYSLHPPCKLPRRQNEQIHSLNLLSDDRPILVIRTRKPHTGGHFLSVNTTISFSLQASRRCKHALNLFCVEDFMRHIYIFTHIIICLNVYISGQP